MNIDINSGQTTAFKDLNEGDVFVRGNKVYMKILSERANVVRLADGVTDWLATNTAVAKVNARLHIEY